MKLENQVLSIDQVQELIELVFDVEKNASMKWSKNTITEDYYVDSLTDNHFEIVCFGSIPTMTVTDILEVLPKEIEMDNKKYNLFIAYVHGSISIYYDIVNKIGNLKLIVTGDLIDGLFEALKWCIKNKHIAL